MKTLKQIIGVLTLMTFLGVTVNAQHIGAPLVVPGDQYAFAYSNNGLPSGLTPFGLYFNETGSLPGFEFRGAGGAKLVNVQSIPSPGREPGDITFGSTGSLIVGPNRYAFRFSLTNTYGLFFNAAQFQYEFRTSDASPVLMIHADNGDVTADGLVTGNGSSAFGDIGVKGIGGNGPTNGYLGVNGSVDFDGEDSLDISGTEIGVLGVSTGGSSNDNTGVYGFSNGTAVRAVHEINDNEVELASITHAILATGNASITGETDFVSNLSNSATTKGPLRLSTTFGSGIAFDNNEVQSYSNATTAGGTFYLQFYGGSLNLLDGFGGDGDLDVHDGTIYMDGLDNEVGIGTTVPSAKLDVVGTTELNGNVGINRPPIATVDLAVGFSGGILQLGSVEQLTDAGANTFSINSDLDPTSHLIRDMGTPTLAWDELYADNFNNISDRRAKRDIETLEYGLEDLLKLNPVSYILKDDPQAEVKLGLIAQEALDVIPESVKTHDMQFDEEGNMTIVENDLMSMRYNMFIPVLINAVKEQNTVIEEMKEEIVQLKNDLSSCCVGMKSEGNVTPETIELDGPWLGQNVPNPFDNSTVIQYYIPESVSKSEIHVFDMKGQVIKTFSLENGYGDVRFNESTISSGTYIYSLVNDDRVIATKKMILN